MHAKNVQFSSGVRLFIKYSYIYIFFAYVHRNCTALKVMYDFCRRFFRLHKQMLIMNILLNETNLRVYRVP